MQLAPSKPVTVRDLARLAKVSKSTVCYALRDDGCVAAKTRVRVQAIAREMGYVPNAFAASLAASKSPRPVHGLRVAFVTHFPAEMYNNRNYDLTQARLKEFGYETDWFDLEHEKVSPDSLRHRLYHCGYKGIIFSEIRAAGSQLFSIDWEPFSVVCAIRTHYQPPFDLVRSHPFASVTLAWQQVQRAGYSRIGVMLCRHEPRMLDDFEREGALAVLQQGLARDETAIPPYLGAVEDAAAATRWLRRTRPDAVIGFIPFHADWIKEAGMRIPEDISYADLQDAGWPPGMAHVDPNDYQIPLICADHIDQLIRHKRTGAPTHPREILLRSLGCQAPRYP